MPLICPTITAVNQQEYKAQLDKIAPFASRIQIDLTDGKFAQHKTIGADSIWWPVGAYADIHLMYDDPLSVVEILAPHIPNLIIVHAEAHMDFKKIVKACDKAGSKLGVALLPHTSVTDALPLLAEADHALIFSGNLGYQGGSYADIALLGKVDEIKTHFPDMEIGWDGGINDQNVAILSAGGVDVLNVGGFIQNSPEPSRSYSALQRIADETGTT